VNIGVGTGNGANVAVHYVEGDTGARLQWVAGSIPASFTVCSVTRYSGANTSNILGCVQNNAGPLNWIHGHRTGHAGFFYYGGDVHSDNQTQEHLPVNTVWVAMCGTNILDPNRPGIIVNNFVKTQGLGGDGGCALGINHDDQSEWQLSKLYIWNYHLSTSDFVFVASQLHSHITSGIPGRMCEACPANFHSLQGSTSQSACQCNAGYTGVNGSTCAQCLPGTYKPALGPQRCSGCPASFVSLAGSMLNTSCQCPAGYTLADRSTCSACLVDTYKSGIGSSPCTPCPPNSTLQLGAPVTQHVVATPGTRGKMGLCVQSAPMACIKRGQGLLLV